jgi:hydrogenase 3 maturation protease
MEKMKMSSFSWIELLKRNLNQLALNLNRQPRVTVVGIGNELNGDDAAGVEVVRALLLAHPAEDGKGDGTWLLVVAGPAPENFTGVLRRFNPDLVLLVDAADMALGPGEIGWMDCQDIDGLRASTHTLPLSIVGHYLVHELECSVALIGMQPCQFEFGKPLTQEVSRSVSLVVVGLSQMITEFEI